MWAIFHLPLKRGKYAYQLTDEREKKLMNQTIKIEFWMWGSGKIERQDIAEKTVDNFKPVISGKIKQKN